MVISLKAPFSGGYATDSVAFGMSQATYHNASKAGTSTRPTHPKSLSVRLDQAPRAQTTIRIDDGLRIS